MQVLMGVVDAVFVKVHFHLCELKECVGFWIWRRLGALFYEF